MRLTYSTLMHSKFFNPAFNSAIFDGPLRIYFAQFHEALALKIYFSFQQKHPELWEKLKDTHRKSGRVLFVMLYPSADAYKMSFEEGELFLSVETLEEDLIMGIRGPFEDDKMESVLTQMKRVFLSWGAQAPAPEFREVTI